MVDQGIVDYIKENLERGFSLEQIKQTLINVGWKQEEVNNAIDSINQGTKPADFIAKNQDSSGKKSNKKIVFVNICIIMVFCLILGFFLYSKGFGNLQTNTISLHINSGTKIDEKWIKLVSIGENDEITIDVDGMSETIEHSSKKVINGLEIENVEIKDNEVAKIKINVIASKEKKDDVGDEESKEQTKKDNDIIDCGQSADISTFPDITIEAAAGGTITTKDYESDPALVCFGNNLLECKKAKVILNNEGGLITMEIKRKDSPSCIIREEIGEMNSEQYKQFSNTDIECPLPFEDLKETAFTDMVPKDQSLIGLPGQTTVGVSDAIIMGAVLDPESDCTGTLIDKLKNK